MAFNRVVELSIGEDGTGVLISALDIDFRVEKTATLAENYAEFTIYNAKESTRNDILKKGANVILSLGYEDEAVGTVFIGNIDKATSSKKGPDWITKIKAYTIRSKDAPLEIIPISLSYGPGTSVAQPIRAISQAAGLTLSGVENVQSITLPNGWVFAGTFKGALRYLKGILDANDIGIYIDNSEVVLYQLGVASRYKVVLLSTTGGLLSITDITKAEETKKRIEFTSLVIPQIRVNGVVTVTGTDTNNGSYIVDQFSIDGNNYGGKFEMVGEATA